MKKSILYTVTFVALWVVVLLAVEGVFRLVGVGYSTEPFERVPGTPYSRDNPDFLNKYYPGRHTSRDEAKFKNLFLAEKPTNGLRIMILGGSTAQGWPFEPNQSFGKMIEKILQRVLPERYVEVINLGYSAMSSYYVADVTKKIFRYQPDILLLYTGQNEYYGTISVTTGGGFWAKKAYLWLREWRIFQWLFGLFEKRGSPSQTMMAAQFAGKRLPFQARDALVAEAFARNIASVCDEAARHHVSVVIYEMAANLIHMPPFASVDEEVVNPLILASQKRFRRDTWRTDTTQHLLEDWVHRYPSNAHVWYLMGIAQRARGEEFLSTLRYAKDLDAIPFRYREVLREVLWREATNRKAVVIPLQQEIEKRFGGEGFGRLLFVDHLHFQYRGQVFLAELGARAILSQIAPDRLSRLESLLETVYAFPGPQGESSLSYADWLGQDIWMTVYDEFMAIQNVLLLLSQSPYREMVIPFTRDPAWGQMGMLVRQPFASLVQSYHPTNQSFGNYLLSELARQGKWEMIEQMLRAYQYNNPGWFAGYKNCGDFFLSRGRYEEALVWYGMAFLLSEGRTRGENDRRGEIIASTYLHDPQRWQDVLHRLAKNPWFVYNTSAERRQK